MPEPVTIDPFSAHYWDTQRTALSPKKKTGTGVTGPAAVSHRPALLDKTRKINGINPAAPQVFKAARLIPAEDMESFKAAIDGQDLTKIAMIEHLKKLLVKSFGILRFFAANVPRFPKHSKDAIVNTLASVAERESKKSNAKWHLKSS